MMRTAFWTAAIKWHLEQGERLQRSTCAGGQICLDWFSYLWIQTFLIAALELKLCFSCMQCGSQSHLDRNRVLVSVLKTKPSSFATSFPDIGDSVWATAHRVYRRALLVGGQTRLYLINLFSVTDYAVGSMQKKKAYKWQRREHPRNFPMLHKSGKVVQNRSRQP